MRISISKILWKRKITALLVCIFTIGIIFAALGFFIFNNPFKSKAASVDGCPANICTISGSGEYYLGDNLVYDNKDLIIDGSTVIIAGQHHFNNLTIRNGGILTHDQIYPSDVDTTKQIADPSYLKEIGRKKKVDLIISSSLVIEDGRISADGKGYPGGHGSEEGYGPGGGSYCHVNDEDCGSAGGSYGGVGGEGVHGSVKPPKPVYGDQYNPTEPGSGGGGGHRDGSGPGYNATGGSGGGVIIIQADSVNITKKGLITANGTSGDINYTVKAGSGSGGTINLKARSIITTPLLELSALGGLEDDTGTNNGTIVSPAMYYNIRTEGGISSEQFGWNHGTGGGGRISINGGTPGVSTKKALVPLDRPGVGNAFNPYALQKDDRITVHLYATNIAQGASTTISDEILKFFTDAKCLPEQNSWSDLPLDTAFTNGKIEWTKTPDTNGEIHVFYNCKVQ